MGGIDHRRGEGEADPKALELDRDRRDAPGGRGGAGDWHRKFTAGEKARGLTGHCRQVRFANAVMNPSCSSALTVAETACPIIFPTMIVLGISAAIATGLTVWNCRLEAGLLTAFCQLTPISLNLVTLTSAIFTCRLTWFGVATVIRLITCEPLTSPAIDAASARTLSACPASDATPLSTRLPSTESAEIRSPGASCRNDERSRETSCSTRMGAFNSTLSLASTA